MAHWCLCASIAHATVKCACHIACNSVESNSLQDPEIDLSLSLSLSISIHLCQKFTHGPWCSWKLRPSTKCYPSWCDYCVASIASGSCIVAQSPCFAEWRRSGHCENFDANGTNRTSLTQSRLGTYFGTAAHTHTRTTVVANSVVECILRAKTTQLHLTGMGRWGDPENIEKLPSP